MDTLRTHAKRRCTRWVRYARVRRLVVAGAMGSALGIGGVVHGDQRCFTAIMRPRTECAAHCEHASGTVTFAAESDHCPFPSCQVTPDITLAGLDLCGVDEGDIVVKLCPDDGGCECPDSPDTITLASGVPFEFTPGQWAKLVGGLYVVDADVLSGMTKGKFFILPALSGWGMIAITLLLLTGIKVKFGLRRAA